MVDSSGTYILSVDGRLTHIPTGALIFAGSFPEAVKWAWDKLGLKFSENMPIRN